MDDKCPECVLRAYIALGCFEDSSVAMGCKNGHNWRVEVG